MDALTRLSPAIFMASVFMYAILNPCYNSIYFLVYVLIVQLSNNIFKAVIIVQLSNNIFKQVAKKLYGKRKSVSILGRGSRPEGACGCGLINDNKPSTTFGMPSGHSQIAWSVSTYLILKYKSIPHIIFLLTTAIYISFSRVQVGCHTPAQVITGAVIGIFSGFIAYSFNRN